MSETEPDIAVLARASGNPEGELTDTIVAQFESELGFSESDSANARKLLGKTDVNSQSWETLLARIAYREDGAS